MRSWIRRSGRWCAVASLTIGCAVVGSMSPARAAPSEVDRANARELFNQGIDLRAAQDHKGALAKFVAADALASTPKTRLELGRQQMLLGMLVEARVSLLSVANVQVDPTMEAKYAPTRAEAVKLADELKPRIPTLRIRLEHVPLGAPPEVAIDGAIIPAAALAERRMVNPGSHVVSAKLGATARTQKVEVGEGDDNEVVIDLAGMAAPPPPAPAPLVAVKPASGPEAPPPTGIGARGVFGVVLLGVGVVELGAATYLTFAARAANADSKAPGFCDATDHCTPAGVSARERAIGRANLATVLLFTGVATLGAGAIVWLSAPSPAPRTGGALPRLAVGVSGTGLVLAGGF